MPRKRTLTGRKERVHDLALRQEARYQRKKRRHDESLLTENASVRTYALNFEDAQKDLKLYFCKICHRHRFLSKIS